MRAERNGHELQTANRNFSTYNTDQNTLLEHVDGKNCDPAPQPARSEHGQLIWKIQKKRFGLALLPTSLEQAHLVW